MKKISKNLLSRKVYRRVARNSKLSKTSPRVTLSKVKGFRGLSKSISRVILIFFIILYFCGYYPVLAFPPIRHSTVLAEINSQVDQIITTSFPQPVILPLPGYLSTRFSSWHPGIDIASGLGMPIHPITAGTVSEVNFNFWGYGNHVIVSHQNNFKSLYAHMGRIFVKKGQPVTSEDILGEVGLTGYTTGPHTHLEISYQGKNFDPLAVLPPIPDMPASLSLKRGEPKLQYLSQQSLPQPQ